MLAFLLPAHAARAYVDGTPSLGKLMTDATHIVVLRVETVSQEKRVIIFKKMTDLKGTSANGEVKHKITDGFHPREPKLILDWAEPGKIAIAFHDGKAAVICIGPYWYQCSALEAPWWTMTTGRPELSLAYFGSAEKLQRQLPALLAGKEETITAVSHGDRGGAFQYENVAFRKVLRGKDCPVWRIKASLKMPGNAAEIGSKDSKWVVGPGWVDAKEVPALAKALRDSKAGVRAQAADDLGLAGPLARGAVPDLVKAYHDADPFVRISAAKAVCLIGQDNDGTIPTLQELLADKRLTVRRAAAEALGDVGDKARPAVGVLIDALKDSDANVRWTVAEALGRIGGDAEAAIPALAEALRDQTIRVMAADALGAMGAAARGAVPLLTDALKSDDANYRWTAAIALTRIDGKSARPALPLFIEKLKSNDARARWDAMMFVNNMGREARDAAPAVLRMVKDGDGVAARCLVTIAGPDAIQAIPILIQEFADDGDNAESLAEIGPGAVPALLKYLHDPKMKNRRLAVKTLGLIGPKSKEVVPTLIATLKHADPELRSAAANALAGIDPKLKEALPPLTRALKDKDIGVRLATARAILAIQGPDARALVPVMVKALAHDDGNARRDAAQLLGDLGLTAKTAMPALRQALQDKDPSVRSAAAYAIARISTAQANHSAAATMLEAFKDKDARVRLDAVRFLGMIGPDASAATAVLTQAKEKDEDEGVRKAAAEALTKIQAK